MDQGSEGRFINLFRNLFRKSNGHPLEEHIQDARDEGVLKPEEEAMLLNVLALGRKKVADVMVPRIEIACADVDSSIDELGTFIVECGHSRIPIYENTRDDMIGIVLAKDVLRPLIGQCESRKGREAVRDLLRPVLFVNENASIRKLLRQFQTERAHLAIVLDEYGGTAGLVTLEDILEQIVGDIEDEYDADRPDEIEPLEDGSMRATGRTSLEEVNEALGLKLTSDEVETIGGYLSQTAGRIPRTGERFDLNGWCVRILDADAKHVKLVHMQRQRCDQKD